MTTAKRQHARAATTRYGGIRHDLVPTSRRPPPAFYGVPPAPDRAPDRRAPISVSRESIRPGMEVYDYDGVRVGWVKDIFDTEFLVGRRWRGDLRVPLEQVLAVLDRRVVLTVPRAQAGTAERA